MDEREARVPPGLNLNEHDIGQFSKKIREDFLMIVRTPEQVTHTTLVYLYKLLSDLLESRVYYVTNVGQLTNTFCCGLIYMLATDDNHTQSLFIDFFSLIFMGIRGCSDNVSSSSNTRLTKFMQLLHTHKHTLLLPGHSASVMADDSSSSEQDHYRINMDVYRVYLEITLSYIAVLININMIKAYNSQSFVKAHETYKTAVDQVVTTPGISTLSLGTQQRNASDLYYSLFPEQKPNIDSYKMAVPTHIFFGLFDVPDGVVAVTTPLRITYSLEKCIETNSSPSNLAILSDEKYTFFDYLKDNYENRADIEPLLDSVFWKWEDIKLEPQEEEYIDANEAQNPEEPDDPVEEYDDMTDYTDRMMQYDNPSDDNVDFNPLTRDYEDDSTDGMDNPLIDLLATTTAEQDERDATTTQNNNILDTINYDEFILHRSKYKERHEERQARDDAFALINTSRREQMINYKKGGYSKGKSEAEKTKYKEDGELFRNLQAQHNLSVKEDAAFKPQDDQLKIEVRALMNGGKFSEEESLTIYLNLEYVWHN